VVPKAFRPESSNAYYNRKLLKQQRLHYKATTIMTLEHILEKLFVNLEEAETFVSAFTNFL